MAATKARSGFGTKLQLGDGGSPTELFTTIEEVLDVNGPETRLMTEDATHMESPEAFTEFIATVLEGGNITCDMNLIQDSVIQRTLRTVQRQRTKRNYRLLLPGETWGHEISGFIESFNPSHPVKGKLVASLSIKLTGPVTYRSFP